MDTKTSFEAQVRVDPLSNDSGIGYSRLLSNSMKKRKTDSVYVKCPNKERFLGRIN